jgi:hypothetical protein
VRINGSDDAGLDAYCLGAAATGCGNGSWVQFPQDAANRAPLSASAVDIFYLDGGADSWDGGGGGARHTVHLFLRGVRGNQHGAATPLNFTASVDRRAPRVIALSLPSGGDASGGRPLAVALAGEDAGSGVVEMCVVVARKALSDGCPISATWEPFLESFQLQPPLGDNATSQSSRRAAARGAGAGARSGSRAAAAAVRRQDAGGGGERKGGGPRTLNVWLRDAVGIESEWPATTAIQYYSNPTAVPPAFTEAEQLPKDPYRSLRLRYTPAYDDADGVLYHKLVYINTRAPPPAAAPPAAAPGAPAKERRTLRFPAERCADGTGEVMLPGTTGPPPARPRVRKVVLDGLWVNTVYTFRLCAVYANNATGVGATAFAKTWLPPNMRADDAAEALAQPLAP